MKIRRRRILVTGSGGIGGVNFVRALRLGEALSGEQLFIAGTEFNRYHSLFPDLDKLVLSPRHSSPAFMKLIVRAAQTYKIQFVHPQPSSEAKVICEKQELFSKIHVKTFLPNTSSIAPDKYTMWKKLSQASVSVPRTYPIHSENDIAMAFRDFGSPLWLRATRGAGARLGLRVDNPKEALLWLSLNKAQKRARTTDFIIQEFLPGRDLAFDSLWFNGEMVTSSSRERLEYPFKHISLSGLTGTPSVARIIHEKKINVLGQEAIKALDSKPNGFYSVDMKEDENGKPSVTEVDGKWHTTAPLWGYAFAKKTSDNSMNIAYTYLRLGMEGNAEEQPKTDLYPDHFAMIRQMDCGVLLLDERTRKSTRIV